MEDRAAIKRVSRLAQHATRPQITITPTHITSITAIAFSPDGKRIYSGSAMRRIEVHTTEGILIEKNYTNLHPEGKIKKISVSTDGTYLISLADSGSCTKINLENDTISEELDGKIIDFAIAANSNQMVCVYQEDMSIRVLSLLDDSLLNAITNLHEDPITCICLASDNKTIISGDSKGNVKLYDLNNGDELANFESIHSSAVMAIRIADNCQYFLSVGEERSVKVYDFQRIDLLYELPFFHGEDIIDIKISFDSKFMLSSSKDGKMKLYDLHDREIIHVFHDVHKAPIESIDISSDGQRIASAGEERKIRLFDLNRMEVSYRNQSHHNGYIGAAVITKDSHRIITGGNDHRIQIFNTVSKTVEFVFGEEMIDGGVLCLALNADDSVLAAGIKKHGIYFLDLKEKRIIDKNTTISQSLIPSIEFHDDFLICACHDHSIRIFDYKKRVEHYVFEAAHSAEVTTLDVASNGKWIVSGSKDHSICIFPLPDIHWIQTNQKKDPQRIDTKDNRKKMLQTTKNALITAKSIDSEEDQNDFDEKKACYELQHQQKKIKSEGVSIESAHIGAIDCVKLSFDLKKIVSSGRDNSVRIWDFESRELVYRLKDIHREPCFTIDMTADFKFIVTGAYDGLVKIIDTENLSIIHEYEIPIKSKKIRSVSISKDRSFIAVTGKDKSLTLLNPLVINSKNVIVANLKDSVRYRSISYFAALRLKTFLEAPHDEKSKQLESLRQVVIYPYGLNMFHLLSGIDPVRRLLKKCITLKIPFLLDSNNKTPLHYLLRTQQVDLIDLLFKYSHEIFLKANDNIFHMLTPYLPDLIRTNSRFLPQFLKFTMGKPKTIDKAPIPRFGKVRSSKGIAITISDSRILYPEYKHRLIRDGDNPLFISVSKLQIDYVASSNSFFELLYSISECQNLEIFRCALIHLIIEFNWKRIQINLIFQTLVYTLFAALVAVHAGLWKNNNTRVIEIVLIASNSFFIFYEFLQFLGRAKNYFLDFWNYIDLARIALLYTTILWKWLKIDSGSASDYETQVMESIVGFTVMLTTFKLISYLRIFDSFRNLIRMIVQVSVAIWSFLVVLLILIVGFAVIFMQYQDDSFGDQLLFLHNTLYGNYDTSTFGPVQLVFFAIISLIMCIVLLNLLISIMGDTYSRVLENKIPSDGLEKIEIILEVIQVNRNVRNIFYFLLYCFKKRRQAFISSRNRKGYLLVAAQSSEFTDDAEDDSKEIEGRLRSLKQSVKMNLTQLKEENNLLRQDLHKVKSELQESMIQVNDRMRDQYRISSQILETLRRHTGNYQTQTSIHGERTSFNPQPKTHRVSYINANRGPVITNKDKDTKTLEKEPATKFKYIIPEERKEARQTTATNFKIPSSRLIIKPLDDKPLYDTISAGSPESMEFTRKAQKNSFLNQSEFPDPVTVADHKTKGILSQQPILEKSVGLSVNSIDTLISKKGSEDNINTEPKKKEEPNTKEHPPSLFSRMKFF